MPIPKPKKNEQEKDFMSRCVSDLARKGEFQDTQRVAICSATWKKSKATKSLVEVLMGRCADCGMTMDECTCEDSKDSEDTTTEPTGPLDDTEDMMEDKSE